MKPKGILPLKGKKLRCAAMPLGGIGTGSIAIGGDGFLKQWQITNTIKHTAFVPNSFFAVGTRRVGNNSEKINCHALICPKIHEDLNFKPPKTTNDHKITAAMEDMFKILPGVEEIQFDGEYPISFLNFKENSLPINIRLVAFNPFIPLDSKNSGLPLIIFQFFLKNTYEFPYEITIMGSLLNFLGWDGEKRIKGGFNSLFGGNINDHRRIGDWHAIYMRSKALLKKDRRYGDLTLAIDQSEATFTTQWRNLKNFWSHFSREGVLPKSDSEEMSPISQTWTGSLASKKILNPEESTVITFILAWNFPNRVVDWNINKAMIHDTQTEFWIGNRYNEWFNSSLKVITYAQEHWIYLLEKTEQFHEAFFSSNLPSEVLTSISATFSTIRTPTCFWMKDGTFHGFEGCNGASTGKLSGGSCPLDCTHVWNYVFSLAHLFPMLERTMRETEFKMQNKDGYLPHRSVIPLYLPQFGMIPDPGDVPPAIDGMFGMILKIYRDFLITNDLKFLKESWPYIEKLIKFIFYTYDKKLNGVIYSDQPNTYDCSLSGINTFIGTLYLTSLLACEKIANKLNLSEWSDKLKKTFNSGQSTLDKECWNGEYYIQKYDENEIKKFQYGIGCFSDQLVGQWWAFQLGFGYILPPEHVNKAIESIIKYNFKETFKGITQTPRIFASPSDSALMNCTWPHGNKPKVPTYYSDEVWTGIEYEIAALCIFIGKISDGLKIIQSIRNRYDGSHRNPWNEVECGDHYVRAMSSWTLLHALTGVNYSIELKRLTLEPRMNINNLETFFITRISWGQVGQKITEGKFSAFISIAYGKIDLKSIYFKTLSNFQPVECNICVIISQDGKKSPLNVIFSFLDQYKIAEIVLSDSITLTEGQKIYIELI